MAPFAATSGVPSYSRVTASGIIPGAYAIGWVLCAGLIAGFLLKVPSAALWLLTLGLLACGVKLMRERPIQALALLPIASLIGPITSVSAGSFSVHLGDLYLLVLCVAHLAERGLTGRIALGAERTRIGAIVVLVILSWCLSIDVVGSIVAIVGIVELLLGYVLTLNLTRTKSDVRTILWSWIAAVALSAALTSMAYARGQPLLLNIDESYLNSFSSLTTSHTGFLFRATFFVAGFIYPLAAGTAATAVLLLFPEKGGWKVQLALISFLTIDLVTMGLVASKTAILGVAFAVPCALLWALRARHGAIRSGLAVLAMAGVVTVGYLLLEQVMSSAQLFLLLSRFDESASLQARTPVWVNVLNYVVDSPHAMYLGMGPEASLRRPDHPVFTSLGMESGAVDSGYLFVLLNYGLFVLLLSLVVLLTGWARLTRSLLREIDADALALWSIIAVWLVMELTQQHGVSKPALMIVQVLALIHAYWYRRSTTSEPSG